MTGLGGTFTAIGVAAAEGAVGLGTFEVALEAIEVVLLRFGPAAVVLGALYAASKIGPGIYEAITHEAANAVAETEKLRQATFGEVDALEKQLAALQKIKTVDIIEAGEAGFSQDKLNARKQLLQAQIDQIIKRQKDALDANEAELERQAKQGATILAEAQRKFYLSGHEAIRAIDYEYEENFKKVSKSAQGTAAVVIAANIAIATVIRKRNEELNKENEKVLQEQVSMLRKIAIASETLYPDATFAARKRDQEAIAQDYEAAIRERFRLREQLITEQSGKLIGEAQADKLFANEVIRAKAIGKLKSDMIAAVGNLETLKDQAIYEHRLKALGEIHKLEEEQRQQDRDRALEDQLDFLQKSAALRIEFIKAEAAQTLPERLRQIQVVRDLEIQAVQETQQARLAAVAAEVADYKSKHIIGVAEVEKIAAQQAVMINRDAQAQMQSDRLNAWKEGNDAVIEEQRKVYDSLRSAFDRIWSALTDRSKSVWANIGNALRTALTDAVKSFVTSRVAASLTEAFTGRGVTFPGGIRGFGGNAPRFEGLGEPPA
jgi:hypothetical protein